MKQGTGHRVRIEHTQGGFSSRTEIKNKMSSCNHEEKPENSNSPGSHVFLYPPFSMEVKMVESLTTSQSMLTCPSVFCIDIFQRILGPP